MVRKTIFIFLTAFGLSWFSLAAAQHPSKLHRIGLLISASDVIAPFTDAFRQGLAELGYVEKKNYILEIRGGSAATDRLFELAAELVGMNVAVIVTVGSPALKGPPTRGTGSRDYASGPSGARSQCDRQRVPGNRQRTCPSASSDTARTLYPARAPDIEPRGKEPPADDLLPRHRRRKRRPRFLRRELCRRVPPYGNLCRQDSERRQARRPSRRAADEIRAGD